MTVTSRSFRPSQCSSCRRSSWLLLKMMALGHLTSSRSPCLGLLEGDAADFAKTTFVTFATPLKPLSPPLKVGEEEEIGESRDDIP